MTVTRRPVPGASPHRHIAATAALGSIAVIGLAWLGGQWLATGALWPLRSAIIFAAVMALAGRAAAHHPFPRFGPANQVTTCRTVLVTLTVGLIWEPATAMTASAVVATAAVAAALDGVDGWVARRTGMVADFGARFDMEVDALLILALSVLVWRYGKAGAWVLACGLMRYGFVAAGWVVPWMRRRLRSTFRGKAVAVSQVVGLGTALAPIVAPPVSAIVAAVTLAALTWSFALDVAWLRRQRGEKP